MDYSISMEQLEFNFNPHLSFPAILDSMCKDYMLSPYRTSSNYSQVLFLCHTHARAAFYWTNLKGRLTGTQNVHTQAYGLRIQCSLEGTSYDVFFIHYSNEEKLRGLHPSIIICETDISPPPYCIFQPIVSFT